MIESDLLILVIAEGGIKLNDIRKIRREFIRGSITAQYDIFRHGWPQSCNGTLRDWRDPYATRNHSELARYSFDEHRRRLWEEVVGAYTYWGFKFKVI